jgi:hypothetical protein
MSIIRCNEVYVFIYIYMIISVIIVLSGVVTMIVCTPNNNPCVIDGVITSMFGLCMVVIISLCSPKIIYFFNIENDI